MCPCLFTCRLDILCPGVQMLPIKQLRCRDCAQGQRVPVRLGYRQKCGGHKFCDDAFGAIVDCEHDTEEEQAGFISSLHILSKWRSELRELAVVLKSNCRINTGMCPCQVWSSTPDMDSLKTVTNSYTEDVLITECLCCSLTWTVTHLHSV